ncbi:MAG: thioredoxin fold domain-containing protein [Methylophilus sp.]|uniref:thioredoxin fold domain-containing protein n=1 Tax=Methylophilus sp. TaxID=29541 RepID=UPI003FA14117
METTLRTAVKASLVAVALSAMITSVMAGEESTSDDVKNAMGVKQSIRKVESLKKLPSGAFALVKADNEKTYLISENGRFAIENPVIYDTWNLSKITTVESADNVDKLDLNKIGFNGTDIAYYSYGTKGKPEVTVFVDPRCPHCTAVTRQIPALKDKYSFKIIPIPVLGEESGRIVKNMHCANNQAEALNSIFASKYTNLPMAQQDCNIEKLTKTIVASSLLGIKGVPFTVMPNNRTVPGRIEDLSVQIEKNLK